MLPLIHQVWQPLKLLFESDNIFVVAKAFKALHVFAVCAKVPIKIYFLFFQKSPFNDKHAPFTPTYCKDLNYGPLYNGLLVVHYSDVDLIIGLLLHYSNSGLNNEIEMNANPSIFLSPKLYIYNKWYISC